MHKTDFEKRASWNKGLTKGTDVRVKSISGKLKGRLAWDKGLTKGTDERVKKMSESHMGQVPWNKGLTKETDERIRKRGEALKGKVAWNKGLTKETDERVRKISENRVPWSEGLTKETDERIRKSAEVLKVKNLGKHLGKNNGNWKGGVSFLLYPAEFTRQLKELIRQRDNYQCQRCGCSEVENMEKLSVRYIDYNKENCLPSNLISLCRRCNSLVNSSRRCWEKYFIAKLRELKSVF